MSSLNPFLHREAFFEICSMEIFECKDIITQQEVL